MLRWFWVVTSSSERACKTRRQRLLFFKNPIGRDTYQPLTVEQAENEGLFWVAFSIPNPGEVLGEEKNWGELTTQQKEERNELYEKHSLDSNPKDRTNENLVQVVELLGEAANGRCAELSVVEIPDGTNYTIEEYDGNEHIAEVHKTWS